jgi:hypothetical protein
MQDRINEFIYKEGWTMEVYEGAFEGPHLRIRGVEPDSTKPGENLPLDIHSRIPPMLSLDQFDLFLQNRLIVIETHECREFLRLRKNGKAIFYPHISDRDEYAIEDFREYRGE